MMTSGSNTRGVCVEASYTLGGGRGIFCCSRGSVVDFGAGPGVVGAIVNAAGPSCQGGGGVDGAITDLGGQQLSEMRAALPVLPNTKGSRCRTGDAVRTQLHDNDGRFGSLKVPCVIHAVGPSYCDIEETEGDDVDRLFDERLRNAYRASLREACAGSVETIGFQCYPLEFSAVDARFTPY